MANPAKSVWTLGIDPGKTGALAAVSKSGSIVCWDIPLNDDGKLWGSQLRDYIKFLKYAQDKEIALAVLELTNAMPPRSKLGAPQRQAGTQSSYNFGEMTGELRGIIIGMDIPVANVRPAIWKKHYGLSDDKSKSVAKALELFPYYTELYKGPRGGQKDGRAEAVLLAHYGQRMVP